MLLQTGGGLNSCSICLPHNHVPQVVELMWEIISFIPGPSHHPVFDCLQYAKTEGVHFYHVNDINVYCRMHFGQYQVHQLCWEDYYLIHEMQSDAHLIHTTGRSSMHMPFTFRLFVIYSDKDLLNEAK